MSQVYKSSTSGPPPPTALTQFTFDDGTHTFVSANNVNVNNGTGVNITANPDTSSSFIVNVINDGFPWSDQAISFSAMKQNGYFCTTVLPTMTVTLPTAGIVTGSTIIIYVDTTNLVVIQAGAGQTIEISLNQSTVAGIGPGTATSTAQGNIVTLVYRSSDTTWHAISSAGSFTMA